MCAATREFLRRLCWLATLSLLTVAPVLRVVAAPLNLSSNDVVVLVGGEDIVVAQQQGFLETLLTARLGAGTPRFRSLAWEGDTVFAQPRELNFPKWPERLQRVGATVIACQFGQAESLRGRSELTAFITAYEGLLDTFAAKTPRLVLVSPTPFEVPGGPLPDLSARNDDLAAYVAAIRELAVRRNLPFLDLFTPLRKAADSASRLTRDGLHLNATGHWLAAQAVGAQLAGEAVGSAAAAGGKFTQPEFEVLRQAIVAKNELWFHYSRPQNWAFLGGDRTDQPSSRDHRDRNVRWFPAEMEEFLPLVAAREKQIRELAVKLNREGVR